MSTLESGRVERFIWADKRGCGFFEAVSDFSSKNDLHMSIDTVVEGITLGYLIKKCNNPQTFIK